MEEEEFISIINEYYDFRALFSDNINNASISLNNEDCYLIEESWINNLKEGFNEYKNLKKKNELSRDIDYYDLLPKEDPIFINNFSEILKYVKKNKKIKCISKKLLELIYDKDDLKDYHYIKYYSGNNKLIIEYENDNKAILVKDPLNQREIKNNINIILIKDKQKNKIFKNLLSSKNNIPDKYINYIMPIDKYLNKLKNILKLFIYFYYYERDLKENQEYIFNKNDEVYYLINPEWLNKLKDIFNYSEIYELLKLIDRKIKNINYNNLNDNYNRIIHQINENILIRKKILFDEIFSAEQVKLKSYKFNNIKCYKNCNIINSQIMNIIKSIFNEKEININIRKISFSNNSIYLFYSKKVIIGKLNEILLFIPKYIIVYDSNEILISERNYLLENTIKKYINELKCDINNPNLQILKDNNGNLGQLMVLNEAQSRDKTDNQIQNNNIRKMNSSSHFSKKNKFYIKSINDRIENNNMNQRTNNSYEKNNYNKNEIRNLNNNSFENIPNCQIKNIKIRKSNKKKKVYKIKIMTNEEKTINYNSYNINKNKKKDKLIINDSQENCSENYEENIKLKEEEKNENEDYKLKENELINLNMKLQKQNNSLEESINNYEEINNKLREKENIINDYENNFLKLKDELREKDDKLKDYLNIKKELENKENEIININKKLEDNQNYINELENKDREKENQIKKLKDLNNNEDFKKLEDLLNKSNIENKRIKQINLKRKKKISNLEKELKEKYKINDELNNQNNELKNKIKELEIKTDDENNQYKNKIEELKENDRIKEERIKELENEKNIIMNDSNKIAEKSNSEIQRNKDEINALSKENNILNQKYVQIEKELKDVKNENEKYKLNENELIKSNKKLQKKINDLEKSINNYVKINNKLRGKENIINEYKNKYLNIQKNKENEIINLNKKLKECEDYINELENKYREKENEIIKLENLNKKYQNKEDLLNKSKEESKGIKQINLKMKKELEEQYKINSQLKGKIKEIENGKNDIMNEIINDSENKISQMKKQYDSEIQEYKDEINKLKERKKNLTNNNEQIYDKKRRELDERENMIKMKENEINNKISFLEDKENLIEKENKEIEIKKSQLGNLEKEIEKNKRMIKNSKKIDELKNSLEIYKNPLEKYRIPPLIGLNNIGATCFMNSTLQCLSQTKELTKYFLNINNENRIINNNIALTNKNSLQLSPIYLGLIKKLWDENGEKSFSPYNFMNIVEKMNPLFKQGQAGDSKDFIIFILEQLHKELKKPVNNNGSDKKNLALNQYDKKNAFNYFFNDFQKECSIISDIFFGFTETTNECLYCKNYYNSMDVIVLYVIIMAYLIVLYFH